MNDMKVIANKAIASVDQLVAGLRDGNEEVIEETRDLLYQMVREANAMQLAILLMSVRASASVSAQQK